ncbi:MAG: M23 family metallopeptidase [Myxococcota bacterium]
MRWQAPVELGAPRRRRSPLTLLIPILLVFAVGAYTGLRSGTAPELALELGPALGRQATVELQVGPSSRGVELLRLVAAQGEQKTVVLEEKRKVVPVWRVGSATVGFVRSVELDAQALGLQEGPVRLRAELRSAGAWLQAGTEVSVEVERPVLLRPPRLSVPTQAVIVAQGGSELVRYQVEDRAVRHGIQVGNLTFPGQPLEGTPDMFALFAVPHDKSDAEGIVVFAEDVVGNRAEAAFIRTFQAKPLTRDTIRVTDSVMERVVPRIMTRTPSLKDRGSLLANYIQINADLRAELAEQLVALGQKSEPSFLWRGAFVQMPAKVVSRFADRRTYLYEGKKVDQQDHLGFDLASVAKDAVPAANGGIVVLAEYFGIYGQTVVLDHGYGLMSLYAHLSRIDVAMGDRVEKGQTLGRTGATGLALGDHLHFTTMVRGIPVSPLEWWDAQWVKNRIAAKLGPAASISEED